LEEKENNMQRTWKNEAREERTGEKGRNLKRDRGERRY